MDDMKQVKALQKKTALVLAIKTEGGKALADQMATFIADRLHRLVVTAGKDEDLIQLLYEVRGAAAMLKDLGDDIRSVINLAARNAVKQQMHLTQPPTVRSSDELSTEGEAENRQ